MEIPRTVKIYCKKCKKHEEHRLTAFRVRAARKKSKGTRKNIAKHKKGYGGKAKHIATVKKQSKKPTFVAQCSVCKAKHYYVIPKRMKRVELVAN